MKSVFVKAVKADPKNYEAQTALAGFYTRLARRKTNEAEKHAREALRLDPGRAKAYSILAKVLALEQRDGMNSTLFSPPPKKTSPTISPLTLKPRTLCWNQASTSSEARPTCGNTWRRNLRERSRTQLMPTGCWG